MVQADVYLTATLIGPLRTLPLSDWLLGVSYCGSGKLAAITSYWAEWVRRLSIIVNTINLLFLCIRLEFSTKTIYKRYFPQY